MMVSRVGSLGLGNQMSIACIAGKPRGALFSCDRVHEPHLLQIHRCDDEQLTQQPPVTERHTQTDRHTKTHTQAQTFTDKDRQKTRDILPPTLIKSMKDRDPLKINQI